LLALLVPEENGVNIDFLLSVVDGWLSGLTYFEISLFCQRELSDILDVMCHDIGFHLQDNVAKLCQLALVQYGEDGISEVARAWPSFLQFGLGTLQQLDLCECGASERLALWGIQRALSGNDLRGRALIHFVRQNSSQVRSSLEKDDRVPQLCAERIYRELRIV